MGTECSIRKAMAARRVYRRPRGDREVRGDRGRADQLPLPHYDPARRRPDCTRARQSLNWRPRVFLPDGLRKTVEYFRQAEAPR